MDEPIDLVVAYAFSKREGDRSTGGYHWVTTTPLHAGRLHRQPGDALCKPRFKFWGLEHTRHSSPDVTCTRGIEIHDRLGGYRPPRVATSSAVEAEADVMPAIEPYRAPEFDLADDVNAIAANATDFPDPYWIAGALDSLSKHFGDWRFAFAELANTDGSDVPLWTAQHRSGDIYRSHTLNELLGILPAAEARYKALVPRNPS
jgi:hypothetical protein